MNPSLRYFVQLNTPQATHPKHCVNNPGIQDFYEEKRER